MMDELLQPFVRMLDDVGASAVLRQMEQGVAAADFWSAVGESGVLDLLVPENKGGLGFALANAAPFISALGARGYQHPVAETLIARGLLTQAGAHAPDGRIALATGLGQNQICPGGLAADFFLVDIGEALALVRADQATLEPTGVHGALAARFSWDGQNAVLTTARPTNGLRPIAAVMRALQIAGAAERLAEMSTAYANDRVQFGKPIGSYQAVKHLLARAQVKIEFAKPVVYAAAAYSEPGTFVDARVSHAKIAATEAAEAAARASIQVQGAMGYSWEVDVHFFLKRVLSLTYAWGGPEFHLSRIGKRVFELQLGPDATFGAA